MAETQGILNKLTVAEMGLTKEVIQKLLEGKADGEQVVVARMFGKTSKISVKPSKLDPTRDEVLFLGDFEGVNLLTGQIFNAPKAYLPGAAEAAARNAVENLEDGAAVTFGCEIAVKVKKSAAVGYVFGVSVPKVPQAQDPLAEIREQMAALPGASSAPQLEAPKGKKA